MRSLLPPRARPYDDPVRRARERLAASMKPGPEKPGCECSGRGCSCRPTALARSRLPPTSRLHDDPVARAKARIREAQDRAKGGEPSTERTVLSFCWTGLALDDPVPYDALAGYGIARVEDSNGDRVRFRGDWYTCCQCWKGLRLGTSTASTMRFTLERKDAIQVEAQVSMPIWYPPQLPSAVRLRALRQGAVVAQAELVYPNELRDLCGLSCPDCTANCGIIQVWGDGIDAFEVEQVPSDRDMLVVHLAYVRPIRPTKGQLVVAMTFDYGPDPDVPFDSDSNTTNLAVSALEEKGVPGTFFLEHFNLLLPEGAKRLPLYQPFHEVGVSGVNPDALHCTYALEYQGRGPKGPCGSSPATDCFEKHLDEMLALLRSARVVPKFLRPPVGENWLCDDLCTNGLHDQEYGIPCKGAKNPDPDVTYADLEAAWTARGLRAYLRGGTRFQQDRRKRREFGPDSWWVQADDRFPKTISDLRPLMRRSAQDGETRCAVILLHDYDGSKSDDREKSRRNMSRLGDLIDGIRQKARDEGTSVRFVRLRELDAICGAMPPDVGHGAQRCSC